MNNNRIALYFSGRVYGYDEVFLRRLIKSFETVYDKPVDIFCSSSTNKKSFDQFVELFKPVQYEFRHFDTPSKFYTYSPQARSINPERHFLKMFFHNYNCIHMIKEYMINNNVNYNIVIKFRADILSNDVIPLQSDMKSNTLYIPAGNDHTGINDQFAYGDFKSMEIYSNIWNDIEQLVEHHGSPMHPESLLFNQIRINNLSVSRLNYNYILNPKRYDGNTE